MRQIVKLYPESKKSNGDEPIPLTDALLNETPARINRFVLFQLQQLKAEYQRCGNPVTIYNKGNRLASFLGVMAVKRIYQLGCLHHFLGYLLIAANKSRTSIEIAEAHIRLALSIFDAHDLTTLEVVSNITQAFWLLGICLKMQGQYGNAVDMLTDTLADPFLQRFNNPISRLPLIRQLVIMAQAPQSFRRLGNSLYSHKESPVEYFHSVRRMFEFSLNSHNMQSARSLFSECTTAFLQARELLESVHVAAYYKSVFHYFRMIGQDVIADGILKNTLAAVTRLELHGQRRQIISLSNQFSSKSLSDIRLDVAAY